MKTSAISPNAVTILRVVLTFLWVALALWATPRPFATFSLANFAIFVFYIVLALSDKLDGYLARKYNRITDVGKFLDPLADKILVVAALLVIVSFQYSTLWPLLIICAREFLVSGLRMVVAAKGKVVAASNLGKIKTMITMLAIALYFLAFCGLGVLVSSGCIIAAEIVLWIAVLITIVSGIDYAYKCMPYLSGGPGRG